MVGKAIDFSASPGVTRLDDLRGAAWSLKLGRCAAPIPPRTSSHVDSGRVRIWSKEDDRRISPRGMSVRPTTFLAASERDASVTRSMRSIRPSDRKSAVDHPGLGCLRHPADQQEQAHRHLRRSRRSRTSESLRRETRYLRRATSGASSSIASTSAMRRSVATSPASSTTPAAELLHASSRATLIWIIAARNIRGVRSSSYDYSTDGPGLIRCRCSPGAK